MSNRSRPLQVTTGRTGGRASRRVLIAAVAVALTMPVADAAAREPDRRQAEEILHQLKALRNEVKRLRNDVRKLKFEMRKIAGKQPQDVVLPELHGPPPCDIKIGTSPVLGPEDAAVTIAAFFCLECPFCIREWPRLQQVMREYPDDVRLVFKNFPLSAHKQARPVHAACMFAQRQKGDDAFWAMLQKVIDNPKQLDVPTMREYAAELDLDLPEFDRVLASTAEVQAMLVHDSAEAGKCRVHSTPTIFVNGHKLKDRGLSDYRALIEKTITENGAKPAEAGERAVPPDNAVAPSRSAVKSPAARNRQ